MTMGDRVRRGVVVLGLLVAGSAGCAAGQPAGERVSHAAPPASRSAVAGATSTAPGRPDPDHRGHRLPRRFVAPPAPLAAGAGGDPGHRRVLVAGPAGAQPDGTMQVPDDFQVAGWFTGGPQPGQLGPAVIAGHVDSRTGPAVFYRLRDLRPGDEIRVVRADRRVVRFRVESLASYPKQSLPYEEVYGRPPPRRCASSPAPAPSTGPAAATATTWSCRPSGWPTAARRPAR